MRPMISGAGAGGGHLMDKQSLVTVVKELWNASEIQILILVSLSLQVFLFLFAGMRRRSSGWFLQTVLWLAYLSADSVAVFVLGHLAVRASEPGHQLVSLWAPFVLVHLGGQDTITAFSKQDNELWRRHLLNLVTQVAVAGYVVAKASWPDARLRAAMVLVFLCGCVKYAERTVSLYSADTERLRRWSQYDLSEKLKGQQHERGKRWLKKMAGTRDEAEQDTWATLKMMEKGSSSGPPNELFWDAVTLVADIISVDAPLNQAQSITAATHHDFLPRMLEEFLSRESRHSAYEHVGALLEQCYRRLYTKDPLRVTIIESFDKVGSPMHIFTYLIALFMLILTTTATAVALALFTAADKRDHQLLTSRVDITVTYVLLVGAIALEVSSAALFIFPHLSFYLPCLGSLAKCTQSVLLPCCTKQWSQELRQYNIINTAGMFFIGQWFACDVKSKPVTNDHMSIKEFILDTLLVSGTRKEWRIASTRGQLALHNYRMDRHQHDEHYSPDQHPATTTTLKLLEETFGSSANFPTSVLILHIATDICYHFGGTNHSDSGHDEAVVMKHKQTSTELSNYIMYLVFKCGVMLTTNSQVVHDSARKDIYKVLSQSQKVDPRNKDAPAMKLFEAIKKQQEEDSMGEIQIRHHPEPEKQQDPTIETEIQESTGIDDDNTAEDDYMKKLKRTSKALNSPVLPRAVTVAQELISINDEAERWKLIAAVWAEMLYYTAPRCGGGFHYEHLSTGGEFVSHVLVLMYYLGPFLPPPPDA